MLRTRDKRLQICCANDDLCELCQTEASWRSSPSTSAARAGSTRLPIQYSKVEGGWVNYWKIVDGSSDRSDIGHFQGTPEGALYQRDCGPCHTSQLSYDRAGASPATAKIREGGIDCEMCHGPSQAHVEAMRASPATKTSHSCCRSEIVVVSSW
jgi:hypothetical protein